MRTQGTPIPKNSVVKKQGKLKNPSSPSRSLPEDSQQSQNLVYSSCQNSSSSSSSYKDVVSQMEHLMDPTPLLPVPGPGHPETTELDVTKEMEMEESRNMCPTNFQTPPEIISPIIISVSSQAFDQNGRRPSDESQKASRVLPKTRRVSTVTTSPVKKKTKVEEKKRTPNPRGRPRGRGRMSVRAILHNRPRRPAVEKVDEWLGGCNSEFNDVTPWLEPDTDGK